MSTPPPAPPLFILHQQTLQYFNILTLTWCGDAENFLHHPEQVHCLLQDKRNKSFSEGHKEKDEAVDDTLNGRVESERGDSCAVLRVPAVTRAWGQVGEWMGGGGGGCEL